MSDNDANKAGVGSDGADDAKQADQPDGADDAAAQDDAGSQGAEPTPPNSDDKKYTDADVDRIIDEKFAKWKRQQEKENAEAQTKKAEDKKLADMNKEERAAYELKKAQERIAALEGKEAHQGLMKEARKMLKDNEIDVDDGLLEIIVGKDAESTKESVDNFASAFKTAVEKAVEGALKRKPPVSGTSKPSAKSAGIGAKNAERINKMRGHIPSDSAGGN